MLIKYLHCFVILVAYFAVIIINITPLMLSWMYFVEKYIKYKSTFLDASYPIIRIGLALLVNLSIILQSSLVWKV